MLFLHFEPPDVVQMTLSDFVMTDSDVFSALDIGSSVESDSLNGLVVVRVGHMCICTPIVVE